MVLQIKNTYYYDGERLKQGDIFIKEGRFIDFCENLKIEKTIDGSNYLLLPSFQNAHTHVAMTLLRGYGSDTDLKTWLNQYIFIT